MKIVCDSCSAKYSIADEKVAGRVFKIRCKKCGAAIVVKGDAGQAAEAAPAGGAAAFDYGGEAVWHTVVEGEQQGPFAPAQLGSMISAGTIGWDAYVWREGFDDWKPAQDIEELVQAIMNPGGGGGAAAAEDPFSDQPTMMAGGGGAKSNPPAAAKASKRDAGADLFAQSEASPFGGGGDDDDVVASAPSPRVGAGQAAMTGARNENSVLFSLSNLQALATGTPGAAPAASPSKASGPAPKAGMAAGEGSGLIDIRALASATGLTSGGGGGGLSSGPAIGSGPAPKVDDLLSIGSPSVGLGSALAAPVIIAEKQEPARGGGGGMIVAAAILGIALLGGAGIFAYVQLNQPDPAATAATTAAIAPATPPPATAATPPPTTTVAAAPEATTVAGGATPPATTAGATAPATTGGGGGGHRRTGGGGGGGGGGGTTTTAAADPAPAPSGGGGGSTRASGGGGGGGDRSIDALLEGALGPSTRPRGGGGGGGGGTTAAAPTASADPSLPATPGRSDVVSAMNGVQGAVSACGGGEHGVATVSVSVSGSSGHVSNASVSGQFAGTPVGSCIARAVRGATFPHFRNPTFTFSYPFRI